MVRLLCLALLSATPALAGPELHADRAGVGENTQSAGKWEGTVEGGLQVWLNDPIVLGTQGITGRLGLGKGFELRLQLPDITGNTDDLYSGRTFFGAKWAYALRSDMRISLVPTIGFPDLLGDGGVMGRVSANVLYDKDKYDVWANMSVDVPFTDDSDFVVFIGGGATITLGPVAPFVHGGYNDSDQLMLGIGTAIPLGESAQIDVGVDVWISSIFEPNAYVGSSVAF